MRNFTDIFERDSTVDIVMNIMEEDDDIAPPPMSKFKPMTKKPNAADRFWHDHQQLYVDREKSCNENVEKPEDFNNTYPKMQKELDKRKSIGKVVREAPLNSDDYSVVCRACKDLDKFRRLSLKVRPRCCSGQICDKTRVEKPKTRMNRTGQTTRPKRLRRRQNKTSEVGCQSKHECRAVGSLIKVEYCDISCMTLESCSRESSQCPLKMTSTVGCDVIKLNDDVKEEKNEMELESDISLPSNHISSFSLDREPMVWT